MPNLPIIQQMANGQIAKGGERETVNAVQNHG